VPWGNIFSKQGEYIDADYVAPGVKIREPSKMTVGDVTSLYNHWKRRKSKGELEFRFKKVNQVHIRVPLGRKRKELDWSEMPWMGEDDEESESDGEVAVRSKKSKGKGR
jgi:hypothetical protein